MIDVTCIEGISMLEIDEELAVKHICNFLRISLPSNFNGVVLGVSGGLDSSVVASLSVKAYGSEKVLCLLLPDSDVTPKSDVDDALALCKLLGVKYHVIDIKPIVSCCMQCIPSSQSTDRLSIGNLRARIRMCILYYYANHERRLVVGTGDKSELLIGYFTKYGDGGCDLLPIGDLYKTQVRYLAKYLNIPSRIISKPSSPRLWKDQLAEDEIGFTYEYIDPILHLLVDEKLNCEEAASKLNVPLSDVERVNELIKRSSHKRKMPPIAQLPNDVFL
ncbi:MAG: NAD+ synthase [archaeon GB-1867-097]|nr:NAD+ synthase [Candidatus Culexmicrobium thermophilum]